MQTSNQVRCEVNKRLKGMGREEQLVTGNGYCYFIKGKAASWPTASVYVCYINELTPTEWMLEFASLSRGERQ